MDVIAKWDSFICLEPGSKDDKYFQLFGFSADESTNVEDVQQKLERNKQLQERFSTRVLPYLDHVKGKIRR